MQFTPVVKTAWYFYCGTIKFPICLKPLQDKKVFQALNWYLMLKTLEKNLKSRVWKLRNASVVLNYYE